MRVRKMGASLCVVASLLGAITVAVVSLINGEQPGPYMVRVDLPAQQKVHPRVWCALFCIPSSCLFSL